MSLKKRQILRLTVVLYAFELCIPLAGFAFYKQGDSALRVFLASPPGMVLLPSPFSGAQPARRYARRGAKIAFKNPILQVLASQELYLDTNKAKLMDTLAQYKQLGSNEDLLLEAIEHLTEELKLME